MKQHECAFQMTSAPHRADRCTRPGVCRVRYRHESGKGWTVDHRHYCRAHAVQYRQILVVAGLPPEDVEVCDA